MQDDNEITIESFLNSRENGWQKVISEENAAYSHAEEIAKDQKRIIQDQIKVLEEKENQIDNDLYKKGNHRDSIVSWNKNEMYSQEAILKRRIALASLKKVMPEQFEGRDSIRERDIILYSNPLMAIIARFGLTNKPVNKYYYYIELCLNKKYDALIDKLFQHDAGYNREYRRGYVIYSKDFKTEEDARKYHAKHSTKLIEDIAQRATGFYLEVRDAADNFDEVFDFRLMREYRESENDVRSWSIGNFYNTVIAKPHILKLKKTTLSWPEDSSERITTESEIEIRQEGFDFVVGGDFDEEYKFIQEIAGQFDLAHLQDREHALYEENLRRNSERHTKDTIAMSDEEIMRRWYKKTPEEAQVFRDRLISGEWRVNAWGNGIEKVE